jgi:menaquinone-dependent protoporphyrinogen oxidase
MSRVIVAYATRAGSTRGVAERIAGRLRSCGLEVDAVPAAELGGETRFDALVIGSAVFGGRWMPEAEQLVAKIAPGVAGRPVWLFSVGTFGDEGRILGALARREPGNIAELRALVHARDYRVFAGVIARAQWPLWSRLFARAFGVRVGDNRNWSQIDAFGDAIARELRRGAHP